MDAGDRAMMRGIAVSLLMAVGLVYSSIRWKYGGVTYLDDGSAGGFFPTVVFGSIAIAIGTSLLFGSFCADRCQKCSAKLRGGFCHKCGNQNRTE